MPKVIPPGGKREFQLKVHLNKPEYETLEKLAKFYKSDKAGTLRRLILERDKLGKYVISFDEIISKIKDIYNNRSEKLSDELSKDFNSLIKISEDLAEESEEDVYFTQRIYEEENILQADELSKLRKKLREKEGSKEVKIVVFKLSDSNDSEKVLDYLQDGKCVICDFAEFNISENGIPEEFNFLLGGIYSIKAKKVEIRIGLYLFTPRNVFIQNRKN
tara:strand:+ start:687 stop:1340 length:654 start_codon:yes stop_codon:yes gene_type:complete